MREFGADVVGLVLHPKSRQKFGQQLLEVAGLPPTRVLNGSLLRRDSVLEEVRALRADIAVSVMFGYILRRPFLELFPRGVVNLHPALLPWNRGAFPNVWSIVDGTPSGVTLHYIDGGIDTGDIVAQAAVEVLPADTGQSLYERLEEGGLELFKQNWASLAAGTAARMPQPSGGTSHVTADVDRIDRIELDRSYPAGQLIDILRARTFPPHRGAYFEQGGKKFYLRLTIEEEDTKLESDYPGNGRNPGEQAAGEH
jgi:methionyl-tRNA formyltransferase